MIIIFISALLISLFSLKLSDDGERLRPSPAYTVSNRWVAENGRASDLSKLRITDSAVYSLSFDTAPSVGSRLIIYSSNMGISAYTNGKMLFQSEPEFGSRYNIIPIDELTASGTLYLHLTPLSKMTGSIKGAVKITTQNDFILNLISSSALTITAILFLLLTQAIILAFTAGRLYGGQTKYFKAFYLIAFLFILTAFLSEESGLMQFLIGSSVLRYVIKYSAIMLISVPLTAYITALIKKRSTPLEVLQIIITAYSVIRLFLFIGFQIPLERGIAVSWIMIIAETFILIAYGLRHTHELLKR